MNMHIMKKYGHWFLLFYLFLVLMKSKMWCCRGACELNGMILFECMHQQWSRCHVANFWTSWNLTAGKVKERTQHKTVNLWQKPLQTWKQNRVKNAPNNFLPRHVNETQVYNDVICSRTLICKSTLGNSALIVTYVHSPKAQKPLHISPREQDGSSQSRP